jgi:hypothetical protein
MFTTIWIKFQSGSIVAFDLWFFCEIKSAINKVISKSRGQKHACVVWFSQGVAQFRDIGTFAKLGGGGLTNHGWCRARKF